MAIGADLGDHHRRYGPKHPNGAKWLALNATTRREVLRDGCFMIIGSGPMDEIVILRRGRWKAVADPVAPPNEGTWPVAKSLMPGCLQTRCVQRTSVLRLPHETPHLRQARQQKARVGFQPTPFSRNEPENSPSADGTPKPFSRIVGE